jgi:transposase
MRIWVGVDWGSGTHAVCVIDAKGMVLDRFAASHDRAGWRLVMRLQQRGAPGAIPIAIERPSGLLVDALVEAGFVVTPIHPNVVKACRPRYRAVAAKSDLGDAFILADILRTDGHRLRPLAPQSDAIKALRGLVRGRDDLVGTRVALAHQLSALLASFWPRCRPHLQRSRQPDRARLPRALSDARSAARLGPKRLAGFLAQHRYYGRRSPEALLERLRGAPQGCAGDAEGEAKGEVVRALARTLQALVAELAKLSSRIEHAIAALPDGRIVMSFPRAGTICAAQILAELGDVRARFPSEHQFAAEAGVAPVTYQSGKSRGVGWRWACNKRLRAALTCMADNSRHHSPWAADVYRRARARGCDHPHAIRILAEPGRASSGAPGPTASPTTPTNMPPPSPSLASPALPVDTGSLTSRPPYLRPGSRARPGR